MTTISTLCATSTVLVAPTGLTFGRPRLDPPPPPPLPANPRQQTQTHSPSHPPSSYRPSRIAPRDLMTSFTPHKASHLSSRPVTSSPYVPAHNSSERSSFTHDDPDQFKTPITPIPSSAYSQRPSSSTSRRGTARSNTYSSSSTQPFITPRHQTYAHQPNKLVKRSLSQQIPNSAPSRGTVHQRQIFRRPATSHQRTASWSVQLGETALGNSPNPPNTPPNLQTQDTTAQQEYVHFPRIFRLRRTIKGLSRQLTERDSSDIKRIRPDGSRLTLLFAKSVVPSKIEGEETYQMDSDSDFLGNGHSTPSRNKVQTSSPLQPFGAVDRTEDETHSRQSFSFFRNSPNRKLSSASGPATKLKRKISQRISSAPAANPAPPSSSKDQGLGFPSAETTLPKPGVPPASHSIDQAPIDPHQPHQSNAKTRPRHISMSSAMSSSPEGSYRGQRVFSWGEGDEGDTSDTVYDSFRTGTTRSSYGTPRQPLETLFDKSTTSVHEELTNRQVPRPRASTSQPSISTEDRTSFVSAQATPHALSPKRSPTLRGPKLWDMPLDDEKCFADDEEEWRGLADDVVDYKRSQQRLTSSALGRSSRSPPDGTKSTTPRDPGLRNSVFDWSEPPTIDRGSDYDTPPRPKTVHGKKRLGALGNQPTGRRTQGGLHARSQSVPAFQDFTGRRPDVTHKFGTWGVGSKGATEDWDDDFDFEPPSQSSPMLPPNREPLADLESMFIPDNIQRQQTNVLANIGLLKEWGLLIEELKDLRVRAAALGIRDGEHDDVFAEVDAMIDLADQEHEDDALSVLRSPASSQHLSDDDHDGFTPPRPLPAGQARMSPSEMLRAIQQNNSVHSSPSFRVSDSPDVSSRPRKDSEAIAQSVIQALQQGRNNKAEIDADNTSFERSKKMPFDTTTLKHIVPHVNGLMRQVKERIRDAEGLNTSPKVDRRLDKPRKPAFAEPLPESPTAEREFRLRLQRSRGAAPGSATANAEPDMHRQLQAMDIS